MFCIWPRNTPVLFLANVRKMPTTSQPTPTASLVTHSCKSWSICCVRQWLALHSPPGRSMLIPVTNLHQMKWCGGMTFLVTLKTYVTDWDAPHATGPCGPAFARAFLIIESFRERCGGADVPEYACLLGWEWGGGREGKWSGYSPILFLPFRLQWKRSEAPSRRRWIGKVPFFFSFLFSPNRCMNGMNDWV